MPRSAMRCFKTGGALACSPVKMTLAGFVVVIILQCSLFFFGYVFPGDKSINTPVGSMLAVLWGMYWLAFVVYETLQALSNGSGTGTLKR
mgnify:FL=1